MFEMCLGCFKDIHHQCPHSLEQTEMCFAMSIEGFPWQYTTDPERWFEEGVMDTTEEDGQSWREKYEAKGKQHEVEVSALYDLIAYYAKKQPTRCPKCRRFTDRTGRCDYCARKARSFDAASTQIPEQNGAQPASISVGVSTGNPTITNVQGKEGVDWHYTLNEPDCKGATIERWLP